MPTLTTLLCTRLVDAFGKLSVELPGGGRRELAVESVRTNGSELHALIRATEWAHDGRPRDWSEQELYLGSMTRETEELDGWPPRAQAAVDAFRAWMEPRMRAQSFEGGGYVLRVWPTYPLVPLIEAWLRDGPVPPHPERFAEPEAIARSLADELEVEAGDGGEPWARVRLRGYSLEVFTSEVGWVGDLRLVDREGRPHAILRAEIDGAQDLRFAPFDGDTVTMRGVLEILSTAITIAGKDVEVPLEGDEEDETVPLSERLLYAGAEPPIDWRLQGDSVGVGPLQNGYTATLRERSAAAAAAFDAFARDCIDPAFAPVAAGPARSS